MSVKKKKTLPRGSLTTSTIFNEMLVRVTTVAIILSKLFDMVANWALRLSN